MFDENGRYRYEPRIGEIVAGLDGTLVTPVKVGYGHGMNQARPNSCKGCHFNKRVYGGYDCGQCGALGFHLGCFIDNSPVIYRKVKGSKNGIR